SAHAAPRQEALSYRGERSPACAEYRMNSRLLIRVGTKKLVERISQVTQTTVAPTSALVAANRYLPATSITAHASAKLCRWWLAATQNALAPVASRTSTNRLHQTRVL